MLVRPKGNTCSEKSLSSVKYQVNMVTCFINMEEIVTTMSFIMLGVPLGVPEFRALVWYNKKKMTICLQKPS